MTIVAAWISAETGVGPSIASGSHACSGNWPDLPHAPSSSSSVIASEHAAGSSSPDPREHLGVLQRAELRPQQEDRDRQADVADPVHEERLLRRGGRGRAVLVPADQQVGGQADALPAEVEHHEVVAQHQQQHRGDEQVELGEEPPPAAGRGSCSRPSRCGSAPPTPGDEQHERQRQRIEPQAEVDVQARDARTSGRATAPGCAAAGSSARVSTKISRPTTNDGDDRRDAEHVAPRSARRPASEQHEGAERGQREQQPGEPGRTGGGADLRELGVRERNDTGELRL